MVLSSWILVFVLGILSASADHQEREAPSEGPPIKEKVQCRLDLGLVIDQTKSIGHNNLPDMRTGVKDFVKRFIIGPQDTHVSLSAFAGVSTLHSTFEDPDYHSEQAVLDLIDSSLTRLSSPTRLDKALKVADEEMFTPQSGDRSGFRSVMVIVTDGKTNPLTEDFVPTVNSLKAKGVQLVAIAFGPKSTEAEHQENLRKIAGDSVYDIADYPDLESLFDNVTKDLCPDVCAVDLALVADKTQSIGFANFQLLRGFLLQISDSMDISPATTHEAVITFANTSTTLNRLDDIQFQSNQAMHVLIEGIDDNLGRPTRTDRALEEVVSLFTHGGSRPGFRNSMVILTDGKTNEASTPFNQTVPKLEGLKIRSIAVGIGKKIFKKQLEEIAKKHVHLADDFDDLSNLFKILMDEICSVDGGFSPWSPYSPCSVTCGSGTQQRTRTCTNPPPHGPYGFDCEGSTVETRQCEMSPCIMIAQDSTI